MAFQVTTRSSARIAKKKNTRAVNKIVECDNENKTPITTENNNASVGNKIKRPVLRSRRKVDDTKQTPSVNSSIKKGLSGKKLKDTRAVNKIVKRNNEDKTPITTENNNVTVGNKIKRPVLRSRRKVDDTKQTPSVTSNIKKGVGEKKLRDTRAVNKIVECDNENKTPITTENNVSASNENNLPVRRSRRKVDDTKKTSSVSSNIKKGMSEKKVRDTHAVNKIVECDNENKTPIITDNNVTVSKKNKKPLLRSQRKVDDTKQTPRVNSNIKKGMSEKKIASSSAVNEDANFVSNVAVIKENTTNKRDVLLKKPILRTSSLRAPVLKLRQRKTFNYAESSLDSSIESQPETENNSNKVPIYKQPIVENKHRKKRPGDLYEFDESDTENIKKKKRRKVSHSSSEEYDVTIQNILKNVMNKVRKKNKKEIYSDVKNNNIKMKQVQFVPSTNTKRVEKRVVDHSKENKNPVTQTDTDKSEEINMKEEPAQSSETSQMPQEINQVNNLQITVENPSKSHDLSDAYDFGKDETEPSKIASSKIKIISDIQLQPGQELNLSVATPTTFRESRPKANSTMLNNVFSPWRFNEINIKRNPHFLAIKESSLPCISQEMVLDHTIVDKFEDITKTHSGKTPQRKIEENHTVKKTPVQKYVTDYFSGGPENNKENMNVSLFDYDQFSPIKGRNQSINNADRVKRKILGEKNDNIAKEMHSSTPRREPPSSDDQHTNFGFSSDEESNNQVVVKNKEDKPFRVSINVNDKKYTRPKNARRPVEPVEAVEPTGDEESDQEFSDVESHSGEVRLFEDFNTTEDLLKEPKLPKKRTKLKGFNDDNHKQRRKKDVRTKEEEDEAEKWASAFNSMCEEIEKFPLEIE